MRLHRSRAPEGCVYGLLFAGVFWALIISLCYGLYRVFGPSGATP